jgi:predicted phosphate transport protein (TIGR00153 family)
MRFRLIPTDDAFFGLFCESAANITECAKRLRDRVADPADPDLHPKVADCEHHGDELTRTILQRLNTSFVTPFDREDIHQLAEELDDVVDDLMEVSYRMQITNITTTLPELTEQADLVVRCAIETEQLVARLESMKGVRPHLEAIDALESEGDAVYRRCLARLFGNGFEAIDVLRWKDVVETMEGAMNAMEHVSDVVESIVLKHA